MGRRAGGPCPARGSPAPKSSRQAALLAASILSSCFLLTQAQDIIPVTVEPPKQIKGQDVTLTPGGTPEFVSCNWYREAVAETTQILTYFPPPNPVQQNFTNFTGRETAGPGCTLHIRNLTLNDTGDYIVTKIARTRSERGQEHIEVLETLPKPKVSAFPSPFLIESIDSVNLTCEIASKNASISWLYNGEPLRTNPRIQISEDNRTVAVNGAIRSDTGEYQCNVSNSVSTNQSDPIYIAVIYGPEMPEIHPNKTSYNEHSEIRLSCYADAFPDAHYIWSINEKEHSTKSELLIPDVTPKDSGKYVCQAMNVFPRQKSSATLEIEVAGSVYNVTINGPSTAIEYHQVQMNCSSLGSDVSYYWFKGSQLVEAGERIILADNNRTLTFSSSNRNDTASYICQGNNSFSSSSSEPHWLEIFYGPDSPVIEPQESVYYEGSTLNLSCFAVSNPPANYSWCHNNQRLEDQHDSQLLVLDLSGSDAGNYTCQATNVNTSYSNASSLEIRVLGSVYNVTINGPSTAIEDHQVQLNCSSLGSDVSYYWFKGSQLVEAGERIILADNNRTLTFTSSNRNDTASYICQVNNSFSSSSSEPHWLEIFYGPDSPVIEPQESVYYEGSTLNLSCFAVSNPPANYSWCHNNQRLEDQHDSQLLVLDLSGSDAGNYTCQATNVNTSYSNASSLEIRVLGNVYNVTINGPSTAIEDHQVQLNCSSLGSDVSYYWFKGSQLLEAGDRIILADNNRTLTFSSSNRNDTASYICQGNNSFSSSSSEPHWLEIFYGPDSPVIEPRESVYYEGSTLNLSCFAVSNPPANYSWWHNNQQLEDQHDSQLLVPDLTGSDAGNYTCQATNVNTSYSNASSLEIRVLGSVYNVTINGPSTAIEYHQVQLNCSSLGSDVSYYWLKGSQLVEAGDRIILADNNRTLTFTSSNRNDTASYICQGNNSFSSSSSEPHWLGIFYGPDSPVIEPQESVYYKGSTLSLSCFAVSNPPANYSWWHNDQRLEDQHDSQLLVPDLSGSDAGNYTCQATNVNTSYSNASSLEIRVLGSVYNVTINGPSTAIEYHQVQMNCSSLGSDVSYYWFKGSQLLEAGERITLADNNRTLTFTSSNRSDTASYICQGNNSFSSSSSEPHWLEIFYGPDSPVIEPQESVYNEGSTLSLSCFAVSNPPANYSWWHNDQRLEDQHDSQLLVPDLSGSDAGNYICQATNVNTSYSNASSLEIRVLERVSNVSIVSHPAKAIENQAIVLNCSSAGSNVSYIWLKGNQKLSSGEHISLNNGILKIDRTRRNDSGNYTCYGHNSFSNSSASYWLDVFYGPDEPVISPQKHDYAEGSPLNLSCHADSNPPAQYTWDFNGAELPEIPIPSLSFDQAGNYTCNASNHETNLSSSAVWKINVLAIVSNVSIQGPPETTEHSSVTLSCVSNGSEVSYIWFKENQTLEDGGHISLLGPSHEDLTLSPVSRSDAGSYTCRGNNSVSEDTSEAFPLNVLYGPDDPIISPQEHNYVEGANINLTCQAESNPVAQYTWFLNETEEIKNGFWLFISDASFDDSGNYTCNATNVKTNNASATTWEIRVLEKLSQPILWPAESTVKEHENVTLNCTTSESSSVTVSWFKDGKPVPVKSILSARNRTLTVLDIGKDDEGMYTCEARNLANSATSNPSKITLENGGSPDTGLSPGQIVGIVIGCLLGAVLIVALIYFVLKNTTCGMTAQHSSNGNIPSVPGRNQGVTDTKPMAGEEDIQYTTVAFNSHSPLPQGPGPTSPSESGTIYSVIKAK